MVHRSIFPECPDLIYDRYAEAASDAQRWQGIEDGRVRMQDVRLDKFRNIRQAIRQLVHYRYLIQDRQSGHQSGGRGGTKKMPFLDVFLHYIAIFLF
jgi:hypothetical protein